MAKNLRKYQVRNKSTAMKLKRMIPQTNKWIDHGFELKTPYLGWGLKMVIFITNAIETAVCSC